MNFNLVNKAHFIGVGGIGTSALAKLMLKQNKVISGSDLNSSEITQELEKMGLIFFLGHQPGNLSDDTDLVIYSPAVPENNPERQKAKKLKIPQFSYPEFLGQISKNKFTIAISGTHGKSTTTSLLGLILEAADFDPLVIVGSKVPQWNSNLRLSQHGLTQIPLRGTQINADTQCRSTRIRTQINADNSVNPRLSAGRQSSNPRQFASSQRKSALSPRESAFIVEGCEWRAHLLNLWPKVIILTNLEEDHLDYYRDINQIIKTFQKYIEKLPKDGLLILNNDDLNLKKLKPKSRVITYGLKNKADVMAKNISVGLGKQEYDLIQNSKFIAHVILSIPGRFNIYNSLAAAAAALALKVKPKIIKEVLENFRGIWRRFELINADLRGLNADLRGQITVISDYAHHPTAVQFTIQAAREFYPNRRLIAVFQPHHRNRTKKLFGDFVKSFDQADLAIISEIYEVAGREDKKDQDINSKKLVKAIQKRIRMNKNLNLKEIIYTKDLIETKKYLFKILQPNDLVLIMGAGDIYKILTQIV
jgi:UDP-N-acetylmuramate--alanine ligase